MRILTAEDDVVSRRLLEAILEKAGHEVVSCIDGTSALKTYRELPEIQIIILDWMMPGMDGLDVCKEIKANEDKNLTYVIMLTAKTRPEDLALALESGADDYVSKPFNAVELNARIVAGIRMIRLQKAMMENIRELQETLAHVEQLRGILPICAWCKKIRDDSKYWSSVEDYFGQHCKTIFSHSVCPECSKEHFPELESDPEPSRGTPTPQTIE